MFAKLPSKGSHFYLNVNRVVAVLDAETVVGSDGKPAFEEEGARAVVTIDHSQAQYMPVSCTVEEAVDLIRAARDG